MYLGVFCRRRECYGIVLCGIEQNNKSNEMEPNTNNSAIAIHTTTNSPTLMHQEPTAQEWIKFYSGNCT